MQSTCAFHTNTYIHMCTHTHRRTLGSMQVPEGTYSGTFFGEPLAEKAHSIVPVQGKDFSHLLTSGSDQIPSSSFTWKDQTQYEVLDPCVFTVLLCLFLGKGGRGFVCLCVVTLYMSVCVCVCVCVCAREEWTHFGCLVGRSMS
jgi:hypothetical protein